MLSFIMTNSEIRAKFIDFFKLKGHASVPSSSLLTDDPSVLLTTAGMQQFKPYYTGQADAMKDFGSLNIVSIQKCMRTSDIDEVGDDSHLTFFEMLGNFSFGGYWKKEAIEYAHEFITKEMGLKIDYVSVFGGEGEVPADDESEQIWRSIAPDIEIKKSGRADNFWYPAGAEGPCGPTTEIYINGVEIWNIVFNEYYQDVDKQLHPLEIKGIDTGMGLERLAMVSQEKNDVFETDLFESIINLVPSEMDSRTKRIIADHSRAIAFLITDGIRPSNKEQGYVLRRLIRWIMAYNFISKSDLTLIHDIFAKIFEIYSPYYSELDADTIIYEFDREKEKFEKTLEKGIKELKNFISPKNYNYTIGKSKYPQYDIGNYSVWGKILFRFNESYGLSPDIVQEILNMKFPPETIKVFNGEVKKHQEISRAGAEKKFGGHGINVAESNEEMQKKTRLHTATHVIVAALQQVLGQKLPQAGSDITAERLRFDFTFPRKITPEELKKAEDIANDIVAKDLPVSWQEMDLQDAINSGASAFFKSKYPSKVKVYIIGDEKNWFSREICGGPHVSHTGEIGHIKIIKEESISGGNRRIRAIVE